MVREATRAYSPADVDEWGESDQAARYDPPAQPLRPARRGLVAYAEKAGHGHDNGVAQE